MRAITMGVRDSPWPRAGDISAGHFLRAALTAAGLSFSDRQLEWLTRLRKLCDQFVGRVIFLRLSFRRRISARRARVCSRRACSSPKAACAAT